MFGHYLDQPRSKPTIDPLEVPKEDELDALLQLNTTSKQQQQAKKSNPIVYNFSEPIENLHLGLSSSGKDFSRTIPTTAAPPAKKGYFLSISFRLLEGIPLTQTYRLKFSNIFKRKQKCFTF